MSSCRGPSPRERREELVDHWAYLGEPHSGSKAVKNPKKDPIREDRIHNEAIVDAYDRRSRPWLV